MTVASYPKYESYKDSGVEWVGEIPAHWESTRLKNKIKALVNGVWGDEPKENNNIPVLRVADFDYDKLTISDEKLTFRSIPKRELVNRLVKNGDLLLEKSGGGDKTLVGRVVLFDKKFEATCSNFISKLEPVKLVSSSFLKYVFSSLYAQSVNYISIKQTTGIQNLDSADYLNRLFCFPPQSEQNSISAFLDEKCAKIDEAIRIKEEQIKLLNERRQILIQQAVTRGLNPDVPMKDSGIDWIGQIPAHWEVKPGRLFMVENKDKNTGLVENTILSLSYGEIIVKNHEDLTGLVPESYETYQIVLPRDIIIRGTDLQNDKTSLRTGIVKNKGIITSAYICLRVKRTINPDYLHQLLHSYDIRKVFYSLGSGLRQNLSYVDFKYLPITNPTASEQKEIVEYIKNINVRTELSCNIKNQQIIALKEYKTTLINAAVTGKIRITPDMLSTSAN